MATSNWSKLKGKLQTVEASTSGKAPKRKRTELKDAIAGPPAVIEPNENDNKVYAGGLYVKSLKEEIRQRYVGLDCEMVGIGIDGKQSALARCCVVDFDGNVLYDQHVRPPGFVTDFRTKYSGVRKSDLRAGIAITLSECQNDVAALLKNKILVGHGLSNDLDVLMLSHPRLMIRDTATYKPLKRPHGHKWRPRALKDLAKQFLGITIQEGEHDPGIDARSAMFVYRCHMKEWEASLKKKGGAGGEEKKMKKRDNHTKKPTTPIIHNNNSDASGKSEKAVEESNSKPYSRSAVVPAVADVSTTKKKAKNAPTGMFAEYSVNSKTGHALRSIADVDNDHISKKTVDSSNNKKRKLG